MAGWATLWLGGIARSPYSSRSLARAWIPIPWLAGLLVALLLAPLVAWSGARLTSHWSRMARALNDGVLSLKDRDFSMSVTRTTHDEIGELVANYNGLGDRLRVERQSLFQRELMLDTVIQATPLALVLTNNADAVCTATPARAGSLPKAASSKASGSRVTWSARPHRCGKPSIAAGTRCSRSRSVANPRSTTSRSAASC